MATAKIFNCFPYPNDKDAKEAETLIFIAECVTASISIGVIGVAVLGYGFYLLNLGQYWRPLCLLGAIIPLSFLIGYCALLYFLFIQEPGAKINEIKK
ncbi:MAG: hypothetical protein PHQ42_03330 [Patescibacteria group bacterium]|nr:hypothetical protein [Patescibacteria group bacterium]